MSMFLFVLLLQESSAKRQKRENLLEFIDNGYQCYKLGRDGYSLYKYVNGAWKSIGKVSKRSHEKRYINSAAGVDEAAFDGLLKAVTQRDSTNIHQLLRSRETEGQELHELRRRWFNPLEVLHEGYQCYKFGKEVNNAYKFVQEVRTSLNNHIHHLFGGSEKRYINSEVAGLGEQQEVIA